MRVDLPLDREKIVENQAGAPGRRAVVDRGTRAAGPSPSMGPPAAAEIIRKFIDPTIYLVIYLLQCYLWL